MNNYYILNEERKAVPVGHDEYWAWFNSQYSFEQRLVAKTEVGQLEVSTVFSGLNFQDGDGTPLIFLTEVFGGDYGTVRYSTWEEAVAGHQAIVEIIKAHKEVSDNESEIEN